MLERREVEERIAEIKNKRDQTETECVKLAAFLIIRDDFDKGAVGSYGDAAPNPTAAPIVETVIGEHGDSEFLQLIAHRDADHVWAVIDSMMETLKVMEPRLYAGVIRRINE
jgi:hypothetical protein